jgi:GNAT superfamily N-acetyltransferase
MIIENDLFNLKFYETTPKHAKEYGIVSNNPIYVNHLFVLENNRLKGIGKQVLKYIENYAEKNGNDLIFGHINNNAEFTKDDRKTFFCDIDMIKYWLHNKGYAVNEDNNDFHKVI